MAQVNEAAQTKPKSGQLPLWASLLIVICCTGAAFYLFGGQHYLANQSDIEYGLFHHEEDATNPLNWCSWLIQTGTVSGLIGLLLSSASVIIFNKRAKPAPNQSDN